MENMVFEICRAGTRTRRVRREGLERARDRSPCIARASEKYACVGMGVSCNKSMQKKVSKSWGVSIVGPKDDGY